MENKLLSYFSSIASLTPEEYKVLENSIDKDTKTFEKGHFLIKEGQFATESYFVIKGCVREYFINEGEEKTTNFFTEGQWVISLNSFSEPMPSQHYWECTEDSILVFGNEKKAQELFNVFPRFETISRIVMEQTFSVQKALMASFFTDSPEQRYINLLKNRTDLVQRVPQYQLASYIGVKPESLSRIRKRMIMNKF
jgi:CRP-like cAMP-binding protein